MRRPWEDAVQQPPARSMKQLTGLRAAQHTGRSLALCVLLVLLAACSRQAAVVTVAPQRAATRPPAAPVAVVPAPPALYWPTDGWRIADPASQGMDGAKLAAMVEDIKANTPGIHSALVIRHGYIVSENYFGSTTADDSREIYSCTKSFISTLVGMAIDQGLIPGVDARAVDLLPGKRSGKAGADKQAITLEDVLTMRTGLGWTEGDPGYTGLMSSRDSVGYMLDLPMAGEPGTEFNYCSGCSHLLSAIVQQATGQTASEFANEKLFKPLGISNPAWGQTRDGISIGGWGLSLTPREMAKLGYLYLHNGEWDGEQIVAPSWVAAATTRHADAGDKGYGYQWWIYPKYGAYAALGRGGQTIFVIPGMDLIFVTTADIADHDPVFRLVDEYVTPAVMSNE
jgi:CubicO group peptidase (beta-lactamase class C family)